ncbi:MAG: hypothetical protein ACPGQR_03570, partial [Marinirhabdus sp.]
MKNTLYIFVALLALAGCSSDSSNNSETLDSGTNDGQGGSLAIFTLKGEYLYAVDTFGLNVFNIANASNPVLVNEVDFSFNIETLFGYKDYLYIGSRNGMFIYSIENPEFPVQLSSVEHFTAC